MQQKARAMRVGQCQRHPMEISHVKEYSKLVMSNLIAINNDDDIYRTWIISENEIQFFFILTVSASRQVSQYNRLIVISEDCDVCGLEGHLFIEPVTS